MISFANIVRRISSLTNRDFVKYKDHFLPASYLRTGGPVFQDNCNYLASAEKEARRLVEQLGFNPSMSLLDIGCGSGRLAIGVLSLLGKVHLYHGIDVSKPRIDWCMRHLASRQPGFKFTHIDAVNCRYNPGGDKIEGGFSLPLLDGEFDIVYLYSVFSHMAADHVGRYLEEIQRVLRGSGRVFITAFVEAGVPEISINPTGYRRDWSGPLHCVRYEKSFFETLIRGMGFRVDRFEYGNETDGQSAYYLSRQTGDELILKRSGIQPPEAIPGDLAKYDPSLG